MNVRVYATLRPLVGGKSVTVPAGEGETAGTVLRRMVELYPRLEGQILSPDGRGLLPHMQVFIAGRSIRDLDGLETLLKAGDELVVFPPVAGG